MATLWKCACTVFTFANTVEVFMFSICSLHVRKHRGGVRAHKHRGGIHGHTVEETRNLTP